MAMTDQEILQGLGEIIDEVAGVPADQVTPEKTFVDDLDIDSLSMVEIAGAAQDKFGVEIPDDQLKGLKTVQDVVDYVRRWSRSAWWTGPRPAAGTGGSSSRSSRRARRGPMPALPRSSRSGSAWWSPAASAASPRPWPPTTRCGRKAGSGSRRSRSRC